MTPLFSSAGLGAKHFGHLDPTGFWFSSIPGAPQCEHARMTIASTTKRGLLPNMSVINHSLIDHIVIYPSKFMINMTYSAWIGKSS